MQECKGEAPQLPVRWPVVPRPRQAVRQCLAGDARAQRTSPPAMDRSPSPAISWLQRHRANNSFVMNSHKGGRNLIPSKPRSNAVFHRGEWFLLIERTPLLEEPARDARNLPRMVEHGMNGDLRGALTSRFCRTVLSAERRGVGIGQRRW